MYHIRSIHSYRPANSVSIASHTVAAGTNASPTRISLFDGWVSSGRFSISGKAGLYFLEVVSRFLLQSLRSSTDSFEVHDFSPRVVSYDRPFGHLATTPSKDHLKLCAPLFFNQSPGLSNPSTQQGRPSAVLGRNHLLSQSEYRAYLYNLLDPINIQQCVGPAQHSVHLSLGSSQQLYDIMGPSQTLQGPRSSMPLRLHHHSASDPSAMRDAAALLNPGLQLLQPLGIAGPAGPYATLPLFSHGLYSNQFYQSLQPNIPPDIPSLSGSLTGVSSILPGVKGNLQSIPIPSHTSQPSQVSNGPSANNRKLGLYKTELCRSWEEKGTCRYGTKCQFAHGEEEIRKVARHPKVCLTIFHASPTDGTTLAV